MSKSYSKYFIAFGLWIFSLVVFQIGIGKVNLFDWDEINFAEAAREMIVTNNYLDVQIDFRNFWEKPPFFIWLQALSMNIFGINEYAARFPNAFFVALTISVLYLIGLKLKSNRLGLIWAAVYFTSVLPFFYGKSGIIDPVFNFFIFLGIYFFIIYFNTSKLHHFLLSGFFIGLAILTKGPVGFLIYALTIIIYFIVTKSKLSFNFKHFILWALIVFFVGGFWFVLQIFSGNFKIIWDFIVYQADLFSNKVAGHGGFLFYHFLVLFFGVFPASILALPSLVNFRHHTSFNFDFVRWMKILFWTVLILFTIVKTKIVHYSSMCYVPLTFLAAFVVDEIFDKKIVFQKVYKILLLIVAFTLALGFVSLPLIEKYKLWLIQNKFIKDSFVIEALKIDVNWSSLIYPFALIFFILVIYSVSKINKNSKLAFTVLFIATLLFTNSVIFLSIKNIEAHSQRSLIEFLQSNKHKDIFPWGFKTYAHFFYSEKMPNLLSTKYNELDTFLIKTNAEALVIVKNKKYKKFIENYPNFEIIEQKGGFIFLKRKNYD